MIEFPKVFVLGAGASIPFGFPSGRSLVTDICRDLGNLHSEFKLKLQKCGFDEDLIVRFRKELHFSMQPSVDIFLEKRPEYLEIGKAAIAATLIAYENPNYLGRKEDGLSWYEYLFTKLETSPEKFSQNKLAIITFNYDRSLEHFLFVALRHTYDLKESKAAELVHSIPIIHVYGQLGAFPFLGRDNERYYTPEVKPESVRIAASGIKIISEGEVDTPEFMQAHELIVNAKVVCFLGFGFHTENVKRLTGKVQQQLGSSWNFRTFYGSAYDVKEGERPLIKYLFKGRIKLGNEDEDVLNYLRNNHIFLHRAN